MSGAPQTDLLYMDSIEACYDKSFEARVVKTKQDYVVLDQSLFYPIGGGQDWDTGILEAPDLDDPLRVKEVTKRGLVKHVVDEGHGLAVGDTVQGRIDWDRRYAHMRMHTAQHLVSGLAYEMFGSGGTHPRTVGNQIHADRSRIDFRPIDLTPEMMSDLEAAANDVVKEQLPIKALKMTRSEITRIMPEERTNLDLLPKSVTDLRVIRIGDDLDLCPCAGTHVLNTKEIGEVQMLGRKSKGSGTQRLEYTLSGLGRES